MSSNIPINLFSKYILRFWNVHDNSYHLNSFLVRLRISKWHQITVNTDWTKCTWFLLTWSHTDNERDNITKQTVGCHSLQALLERWRGYGRLSYHRPNGFSSWYSLQVLRFLDTYSWPEVELFVRYTVWTLYPAYPVFPQKMSGSHALSEKLLIVSLIQITSICTH